MVCRHGRRRVPEHRHHRGLRPRIHRHPGRRPRLQDGLRDHAPAACGHGRGRHDRLPGGAAHGGGRLRRDACRRQEPDHRLRREAGRPARHSRPPGHGAGLHGHLRLQHQVPRRPAAPRRGRPQFQPRLRPRHRALRRQARHGLRPHLLLLRGALGGRIRLLLARRRHGGRLLAGQYRPHRRRAAARHLRPRLADLDLCRRDAAAKFVHDEDGRRGMAISSLVSGDCIISGGSLHRSLLFTGVRQNSYSVLNEAVVLPHCHIGRGARVTKAILDRASRSPTGSSSARTPSSTRAASAARPAASASSPST